ncbi:MAG: hypothetical protein HZA23_01150 [Nitrospirae bacterium]|nr:hypothetical protein [Nitrospirota bacterium]
MRPVVTSFIAAVLGLFCLFVWGCGQQASHAPAPSGPAPTHEQTTRPKGSASLPEEVMRAYQAARAAVRQGDYAEARQQLLAAVAAKPDFTPLLPRSPGLQAGEEWKI